MKLAVSISLLFMLVIGLLSGCAPVRDAAGNISDDIGEVSDELGKERKVGTGDDAIIVEPMADKKIKMSF